MRRNTLVIICWGLLFSLLLGGCAVRPARQAGVEDRPVSGLFARPDNSLQQFKEMIREKIFELVLTQKKLKRRPDDNFQSRYYSIIEKRQVEVTIGNDVSAYALQEDRLAIALSSGLVSIWGPWNCTSVRAGQDVRYAALKWAEKGSVLEALGPYRKRIHVFDVKRCGLINRIEQEGALQKFALSASGRYTAAVDEVHALWLGPSTNELSQGPRLRFPTVGLHFTPRENMLLVADSSGWVTVWDVQSSQQIDQFYVQGGPFSRSALRGSFLELENENGTNVVWNLATQNSFRQKHDSDRGKSRFSLQDGVFAYQSPEKYYVRDIVMQAPQETRVWYSKSEQKIKIRYVNGKEYFFSLPEGEFAAQVKAADWQEVELNRQNLQFQIDGVWFQAGEIIARQGKYALICQVLKDNSYLVHWKVLKEDVQLERQQLHKLPLRRSIRKDAQKDWITLPAG